MGKFLNKNIKENTCGICGNVSDNGIIVKGELICPNCELDLINSKPENNEYDYYVDKIRTIFKVER